MRKSPTFPVSLWQRNSISTLAPDSFNPQYLTQRCSFLPRVQVDSESTEPSAQTEQVVRCYGATLNPFESFGYCQDYTAVQTKK